jgi:hypothetical protein
MCGDIMKQSGTQRIHAASGGKKKVIIKIQSKKKEHS